MVDGRQLRRTWSDAGFMIERDGAMYSDAVDPAEFDRVYTETDIPIEVMEDDIEKEDLPFDKDSINDMFDLVEDKMADLEAQLTYDNMDEDVPF